MILLLLKDRRDRCREGVTGASEGFAKSEEKLIENDFLDLCLVGVGGASMAVAPFSFEDPTRFLLDRGLGSVLLPGVSSGGDPSAMTFRMDLRF